jgi:hypothetical protein
VAALRERGCQWEVRRECQALGKEGRVCGRGTGGAYGVDGLVGAIHKNLPLQNIGLVEQSHRRACWWVFRALIQLLQFPQSVSLAISTHVL